jgi:tetratricopeptide (TPR) repeat protein
VKRLNTVFSIVLISALYTASSYADSEISQLEKYFLEGRYERAVNEAESLIGSRSRRREEVYYLKGLSELKLKRFGDARQSFQKILDRYPGSEKAFDAYVGIGDSYLLENRASSALKEYNEAAFRFPKNSNIVTIYSRMSDCYAKLGDREKEEEYSRKAKGISGRIRGPAEPREIPRGETGYISVQVGSFKNKKNAEKLMDKLSSGGFESYLEIPVGSGDRLYRVKVGRFRSMDSAEALSAKLKARGYATRICSDNICR